jgi:hypothetical protein
VTPAEDVQTLRDAESVKHALQDAMETSGCLCIHSRCPLHGESTGLLARSWLMLDRLVAELQRLQDAAEKVLPDDEVCACLDETGSRQVRLYERCERCRALMERDDLADAEARLLAAEHALREIAVDVVLADDLTERGERDALLGVVRHHSRLAQAALAAAAAPTEPDAATISVTQGGIGDTKGFFLSPAAAPTEETPQ